MLDIKIIRENPGKIEKSACDKGVKVDVKKLLVLDKKRVLLIEKRDALRNAKKADKKPTPAEIKKIKKSKVELEKIEKELGAVEAEWTKIMYSIPNPAATDVKVGEDESKNQVIKKGGTPKKLAFKAKDHIELTAERSLIDMERGAKVSGTRFAYLRGRVALLELALVNYVFGLLVKEGFEPVIPPVMIKRDMMSAMGYLEHGGEDETYHFDKDDLYLVGTSEQSTAPLYADEILPESELPKRFVSFSTCFRREAGSYGKDTKGIFRVHQFDKVEMIVYSRPKDSDKEHDFLLGLEERIVKGLGLSYQVVKMCTGDLGAPAVRKYDVETWMPSQGKYRETHSVSSCTDFQARRLNIKYRKDGGEKEYVHILNGTGVAVGRMLIAILENYQDKNGNIAVPKALQKYTGFKEI